VRGWSRNGTDGGRWRIARAEEARRHIEAYDRIAIAVEGIHHVTSPQTTAALAR
jgi:hypothetical protein